MHKDTGGTDLAAAGDSLQQLPPFGHVTSAEETLQEVVCFGPAVWSYGPTGQAETTAWPHRSLRRLIILKKHGGQEKKQIHLSCVQ